MKRLIAVAVAALFAFSLASPAEAAYPIYMKNHYLSKVNLLTSTTNPPSSGNLYPIKPGYAGTGLCFYASSSYLTVYWLGSGSVKTAPAGKWTCPAYSNLQYTIRIYY